MITVTEAHVVPDQATADAADRALPRITRFLAAHDEASLRMRVEGERQAVEVPRAAVELLARILEHLAAGEGVSVVPAHAELTTQQAADLLNVSRPFLIGLLDEGAIAYRKVGTHRRIKAASLLDYLRADDAARLAAADELSALTQQMGLA